MLQHLIWVEVFKPVGYAMDLHHLPVAFLVLGFGVEADHILDAVRMALLWWRAKYRIGKSTFRVW